MTLAKEKLSGETESIRIRGKRILIQNFYSGILHRGIPVYVDNLCIGLQQSGARPFQLQCPLALRRLPRPILDLLFIFCEQAVMPLMSLGFDRAIYASNSISVIGAFLRRSALIVHDFIPNRRGNLDLSALYIRTTQPIHAKMGGDVIFISKSTETIARRIGCFKNSKSFQFPNSFYRFLELRSASAPTRHDHVMLCTGWGKNKDLIGALNLYLNSGVYLQRRLIVFGLAGRREVVDAFCEAHPACQGRIDVLPRIDDREVVRAYETAAWVWVHSSSEGYGRSIAEARFCGSRVVASNIAPFREQRDEFTFLYKSLEEFKLAVAGCELAPGICHVRRPVEHEILMSELRRFLSEELAWRGTIESQLGER